jgi:hypothetical protein
MKELVDAARGAIKALEDIRYTDISAEQEQALNKLREAVFTPTKKPCASWIGLTDAEIFQTAQRYKEAGREYVYTIDGIKRLVRSVESQVIYKNGWSN